MRDRPAMHASDTPGVEALATDRAAASLPEGLIRDDEIIILALRPSILYIPLACVTSLAIIVGITFFLAYVAPHVAKWGIWIGWRDTQVFAFGSALFLLRLGWQALEWYSRIYVLTDRRIVRRMGVLRVSIFEAPLKNIQHTSVFTGVRERLFGLGTLAFATAGSDAFDALWETVRQPVVVHKTVTDAIRRYGNTSGR